MTAIPVWLPPEVEAAHDPRPGDPAPICPDHLEQAAVRMVLGKAILHAIEEGTQYPIDSDERLVLLHRAARLMVVREDWDPS